MTTETTTRLTITVRETWLDDYDRVVTDHTLMMAELISEIADLLEAAKAEAEAKATAKDQEDKDERREPFRGLPKHGPSGS
jgi:hypothetical protein